MGGNQAIAKDFLFLRGGILLTQKYRDSDADNFIVVNIENSIIHCIFAGKAASSGFPVKIFPNSKESRRSWMLKNDYRLCYLLWALP